jgi:predicted ATPase with chaperone activity
MSAMPAVSSSDSQMHQRRGDVPPAPDTLSDTGLTADFVRDLLLKTLYVQGTRTGQQLSEFVSLPFSLIDDELLTLQQRRFIEVRGTHGPNRGSYIFDLVGEGRARAKDAFEANQYVGPAPVPLAQYRDRMGIQSIQHAQVTQEVLRQGLSHLVLDEGLFDILGPAVNSSKSIFLYGHPGNGKTAIAEAVSQMLGGTIFVPYAVEVEGQIMVVYDPVHHERVEDAPSAPGTEGIWLRNESYDRRYAHVRRPIVVTGGELTLDQLDLQYDFSTKMYTAPFQLKANGGVLIIDDFGRQRMSSRDLLNRWIVPLEKRIDFLSLHTGGKFPVPFDSLLILSTNLKPSDLVDEAFMRRIHYKIHVLGPSAELLTEIWRRCSLEREIPYTDWAIPHLYDRWYGRLGIEPRACHPRDLLDHFLDAVRFLQRGHELTPALLDQACRSYFLDDSTSDETWTPAQVT